MASFKKRVFGSEVSEDIILEFDKLGTGGQIVETKITPRRSGVEGELLKSVNPTYENYSLGEKTPFTRMWAAVAVTEFHKISVDGHKGEATDINSSRQIIFHPKEDKGSTGAVLGSEGQTTKKLIFTVGQNNENSYGILEQQNPNEDTGNVQVRRQLTKNPFMKPEAGITSVNVKTQGALGALQSTTVNFVVHNKFDFENIFLPYFLRPGSIVCVDYGWSNTQLYNIESHVEKSDIHLSEFYKFLYNNHLRKNFGHTNSVMGNVVSYDSSVNQDGSFDCSIEIISQNASLLDQGIGGEDDVQFLFTNTINDVIAAVYARNRGIAFSLDHVKKNLKTSSPINTSEIAKRFISEISDVKKVGNTVLKGQLNKIAIKEGIFHQDMQPNKAPDLNSLKFSVSKLLNENKRRREAFVTDETLKNEVTYISFGFFEDLFLNNFITGVIKPGEKSGQRRQDGDTVEQNFEKKPDNDFSIKFDTRGVFVRYDDLFVKIKTAPLVEGESLSKFLLPTNWDESYNTRKIKAFLSQKEDSDLDFFIEDKDNTFTDYCLGLNKKYHPDYPNQKVIPLRDVFISVPLITNAFETAKSVNDALINLFDDLNVASNNVWNLKLTFGNEARTSIKVVDANLLPESNRRLVFDVTSDKSLVSACDLSYKTPGDGLSSILAIANMPGPNTFHDLDLASFAYLNLLNRPVGKETMPSRVVSLPYAGDMNNFNKEQEAATLDYFSIIDDVNTLPNDEVSTPRAKEKYEYYLESVRTQFLEELEQEKEEEENKEFDFKLSADYENDTKDIEFVDSYRDYYKKLLKDKYFDREGAGTISPILPIELSLSVYGNTLLQYGDYFTINYLPQYYKNRVFFQIVGISDTIDPNGWTTTYETVMRVDPKFKSLISGEKFGTSPKRLSLNNKLDPISGLTSVSKILKGGTKDNVRTVIEQITRNRVDISLVDNTELQQSFAKSGLQFRAVEYEVVEYNAWKNSVLKQNLKGTKDNFKEYIRFQNTRANLSDLTAAENLAYAFAIRQAFISEESVIDYNRLLYKNVTGPKPKPRIAIGGGNLHIYGNLQVEMIVTQYKDADLVFVMDRVNEGKFELGSIGDDFFDIWGDSRLDFRGGEGKKQNYQSSELTQEFLVAFFNRLKDLEKGFKFNDGFQELLNDANFGGAEIEKNLTTTVYAGNIFPRPVIENVPVPIMSIYTGISKQNPTERTKMSMARILSGQTVFPNITLPHHLFKAGENIETFMKQVSDNYLRYKNGLTFS